MQKCLRLRENAQRQPQSVLVTQLIQHDLPLSHSLCLQPAKSTERQMTLETCTVFVHWGNHIDRFDNIIVGELTLVSRFFECIQIQSMPVLIPIQPVALKKALEFIDLC